MNGIIIKSIGGLYFAESSDGVYECRARGIFRKQGVSPAVGDMLFLKMVL
jgi:ribosome biogenesis GTPase